MYWPCPLNLTLTWRWRDTRHPSNTINSGFIKDGQKRLCAFNWLLVLWFICGCCQLYLSRNFSAVYSWSTPDAIIFLRQVGTRITTGSHYSAIVNYSCVMKIFYQNDNRARYANSMTGITVNVIWIIKWPLFLPNNINGRDYIWQMRSIW